MKVPRPTGLPHRIPKRWWVWLKLPGRFHVRKPANFWVWRSWRLGLRLPKSKAVTMYDAVNITQIPPHAQAVAGYVGGNYVTYPAVVKGWPKAKHLSIAVQADQDAECLDVEKGDATPDQAAAWVRRQHARGLKLPVLYSSSAYMQSLVNTLDASGMLHGRDYKIWCAHWTGKQHLCSSSCTPGLKVKADATQYRTNYQDPLGRNIDTSYCGSGFFS